MADYGSTLQQVGHGSWLEREILAQIEQLFRREDDLTGLQEHYKKLLKTYAQRIQIRKQYAKLLSELSARALQGQDFDVDVRGKFGLPDSMEGMLAFDAILLADMAATSMAPRQMELLKRYVMDFGGGLVMFGSENSFGLGGYYKTPVEEVLPLVSRFEKEIFTKETMQASRSAIKEDVFARSRPVTIPSWPATAKPTFPFRSAT